MPEATDRMAQGGGGGAAELAGGFFIARVLSPGAMAAAAAGPRRVRHLSTEENKENIPPRGSARRRKSPLPSWYPRTPLQDITALVRALEMRRARIRAARAQQRKLSTEVVSPQISVLASPSPQEPIPPTQCCPPDASDSLSSSTPTAGISNPSPTQYQLQTCSTPTSCSPTPPPASVSTDLTPTVLKPTEPAQMLCSSMSEIEKAAKDYLKRTPKVPAKKNAQKTLMSMR